MVFDLCSLYKVRGRVHVIRSNALVNALVHLMHETVPCQNAMSDHLKSPKEWKNEIFYDKRFFRNEDFQLNVKRLCDLLRNIIIK